MDKVLFSAIKQQIQSLKELDFHKFINELYLIGYGNNFTPIKQKRDKGCDGILENQIIIAIYSPEKYDLRVFKKKIGDDFDNYNQFWASQYPKWRVIYNGEEFTSEMAQFVKGLKNDVELVDINHLMKFIESFRWAQIRNIAEYLGIDEKYLSYDILRKILDDLIKGEPSKRFPISYKKPPYIEDKIELNYSQEDIDTAKNEYGECLMYFSALEDILKGYAEENLSSLKSKVCKDYMKYNGDFKTRFSYLTELYSNKYKDDDRYVFYVRVILIYYFEQCLIGKKTEEEKEAKNDTPSS